MGLMNRKTESLSMELNGSIRLGSDAVEHAYQSYREGLLRFLSQVLRDEDLAADALHATFVKLMETGGAVAPEKLKSWLFRVGFNAALNVRRRQKVEQRSVESVAVWRSLSGRTAGPQAMDPEWRELAERAAEACEVLTPEQRQVLYLRLHENLKFREIAEHLQIPLGTVLTRMRTGLMALREELKPTTVSIPHSLAPTTGRPHGKA